MPPAPTSSPAPNFATGLSLKPAPVRMTRAEYQAKYGIAPQVAATPQPSNTPVQMTHAEYMAKYGQPQQQELPIASTLGNVFLSALKTIPGLGNIVTAAQQAPKAVAQIGEQFQGGAQQIGAGFQDISSPLTKPSDLAKPLEGGLKIGSGAVTAVSSPLAPVLAPVGEAIRTAGDIFGNIPALQRFAQTPAGEITARVTGDIGNAANIAGAVAALPEAFASARSSLATTPQSRASTLSAKLDTVANDWAKPTVPGKVTNPASFSKASQILSRDPSIPRFLAENKINPAANIEGGLANPRYATTDTAQALRDTAGQMSRDALRPSLQYADYTTPSVKPTDVISTAIKNAKRDPNITAADTEIIQRNITNQVAALSRKYPNGMSLTNLLDESITYNKNGGYRPTSIADNNIAIANRSIGSALGDLLQQKAPESLPVKEFRAYQAKFYRAADYLDALNNKSAPRSVLQYVAQRGAQVGGAVVGHGIGGGILGGVGGYMIGGALEHALENLTRPMQYQFLQNLKVTNPAAFEAVMNFATKQQIEGLARPALPPASAIQLPQERGAPVGRTYPKVQGEIPKTMNQTLQDRSIAQPIAQAKTMLTKASISPKITTIPKDLQPLAQEAQKYNSAEEFAQSITDSSMGAIGRKYEGLPTTNRPITDFTLGQQEIGKVNRTQRQTSPTSVAQWVEKIKNGERPPVVVREGMSPSQEWIQDGHNRLAAYQQLGFKEVPTITKSQLTDFYNKVHGKK